MLRALLGALAAADTLRRIDVGEVVRHMNRVMLAGPLAHPARDAGRLADCHGSLAHILVGALHDDEAVLGLERNEAVRAGLHALAAGGALVTVHNRDTVADMDGVEVADCLAVAEADTAVRAQLPPAEQRLRRLAGADAVVVIQLLRVFIGAVAGNERNLALRRAGVRAEDRSKLCRDLRAADRTLVARRRTGPVRESVGVIVAAREAAAAAVGTGQLRTQVNEQLIFLHLEDLRCIRQQDSREESDHCQQNYCNYDQIHTRTPL